MSGQHPQLALDTLRDIWMAVDLGVSEPPIDIEKSPSAKIRTEAEEALNQGEALISSKPLIAAVLIETAMLTEYVLLYQHDETERVAFGRPIKKVDVPKGCGSREMTIGWQAKRLRKALSNLEKENKLQSICEDLKCRVSKLLAESDRIATQKDRYQLVQKGIAPKPSPRDPHQLPRSLLEAIALRIRKEFCL